jgi:Cytochrome c7 and related cytochrome c
MAQVFDRSSNALARASLVLTGLIVIALGITLNELQRSPWVTRQGQRPDQPIPFSHKHHVEGLGLQCQYCHTSVEVSSYAGIPPTKTCINCHAQIWTNAALLQPVRDSWATGNSIQWIKVHDLPDFVYFNHSIHVNKGIGCASCHGRVDEMPLMYMQNTLQMEWCLDCHRSPAKNLRPTNEIYNMAWDGPSSGKPVWCANTGKGGPTAQSVSCVTKDPGAGGPEVAMLQQSGRMSGPHSGTNLQPHPLSGEGLTVSDASPSGGIMPASYQKFTDQMDLGRYLTNQYHIRPPNELTSCETCHR